MCVPPKVFSFFSAVIFFFLISPFAYSQTQAENPQSKIFQRLNTIEARIRKIETVDQTITANDARILKQIDSIRIRIHKGPAMRRRP